MIKRKTFVAFLQIMTTPNKGGSKVRHSVGVFGRSLAFSPPLESAASGEHGAITCEVVPPELKEEQIDGLRDEISKLQARIYVDYFNCTLYLA